MESLLPIDESEIKYKKLKEKYFPLKGQTQYEPYEVKIWKFSPTFVSLA